MRKKHISVENKRKINENYYLKITNKFIFNWKNYIHERKKIKFVRALHRTIIQKSVMSFWHDIFRKKNYVRSGVLSLR